MNDGFYGNKIHVLRLFSQIRICSLLSNRFRFAIEHTKKQNEVYVLFGLLFVTQSLEVM